MARPRTLERELLLDAAERIVSESSAAALSFGSVALAAGVPKASVQSAFGTRAALIEAMLDRWSEKDRAAFAREVGSRSSSRSRIQAHVRLTAEEPADSCSRIANLLAAMAASGDQSDTVLRWYESRVGDLSAHGKEERKQRIAFLATEGAFFLRHLVGYKMSDELWQQIFGDLMGLMAGKSGVASKRKARS